MIQYISIYWRDAIEIAFFSLLFYYSALWLKKNRSHNLLPYLYGFILLYSFSYALELNSITYILFYTWPALLMLCILIHQITLQRNFVALKNNTYKQQANPDWLETLMASSLLALSNNQSVYCLIEHTDSMHAFIDTEIVLNAHLNKELLTLIHASNTYNSHKMLWVTTQGTIQGINCAWRLSHNGQRAETNNMATEWLNHTILHTHTTDASAFFGDPNSHTFTLITKDTITSHLSAHNLLQLLIADYSLSHTIDQTTTSARSKAHLTQEYMYAKYKNPTLKQRTN